MSLRLGDEMIGAHLGFIFGQASERQTDTKHASKLNSTHD